MTSSITTYIWFKTGRVDLDMILTLIHKRNNLLLIFATYYFQQFHVSDAFINKQGEQKLPKISSSRVYESEFWKSFHFTTHNPRNQKYWRQCRRLPQHT
jgi:hypothetical protein